MTVLPLASLLRTLANGYSRFLVVILAGLLLGGTTPMALAKPLKSHKAYTFYLSGDRICKKCFWRYSGPEIVQLTNQDGITGYYHVSEIVGVNDHPLLRKFVMGTIHGNGLAGRVIVPSAFDDETFLGQPYLNEDTEKGD